MNHKLLTLLWPIAAYATPVPTVDISASPIWPNSYIAMGDSYAAGIGAGRFFQPEDYANKACKRFDGSYPVQVADPTLGIFNNGIPNGFNFVACTGAVLEDLNRQREILQGKRAQLITISISGNDFDFAEVVIACAYNSNIWGPRDRQCDEALSRAEAKLDDDAIWDDFAFKVGEIISYHLTEESRGEGSGLVLITGTFSNQHTSQTGTLTLYRQAIQSFLMRHSTATGAQAMASHSTAYPDFLYSGDPISGK